jgi:hypothetical protein
MRHEHRVMGYLGVEPDEIADRVVLPEVVDTDRDDLAGDRLS